MHVNVWHKVGGDEGLAHVATVYPPKYQLGFNQHPHMDALEYAFARTQNIYGSWSRGEYFDNGEENGDYSPHVSPAPLGPDGLGHRSSMVGDTFIINEPDCIYIYAVASFGFDLLHKVEMGA